MKTRVPTAQLVERFHRAGVLGLASDIAREHSFSLEEFLLGPRPTWRARRQFYRALTKDRHMSASEIAELVGRHPTSIAHLFEVDEERQRRNQRRAEEARAKPPIRGILA